MVLSLFFSIGAKVTWIQQTPRGPGECLSGIAIRINRDIKAVKTFCYSQANQREDTMYFAYPLMKGDTVKILNYGPDIIQGSNLPRTWFNVHMVQPRPELDPVPYCPYGAWVC